MAHTNPFTPPVSPVGPGPVVHGFAVTPSDSIVFATATRYLWVGAEGGNIAVRLAGDTTAVTLNAVPAGTMLELCCVQVMATNTTATDVVGLY
jgi:hypothetical protein